MDWAAIFMSTGTASTKFEIMNLLEKLRTAAATVRPGTRVIGIDLGTTNSTVAQVRLPICSQSLSGGRKVASPLPVTESTHPEVLMVVAKVPSLEYLAPVNYLASLRTGLT